jgi:large subunit ribosomal protein L31
MHPSARVPEQEKIKLVNWLGFGRLAGLFMRSDIHPRYQEAEVRCACGNVFKTRSTRNTILLGICNACHPFYTGTQKFVDTAGRVDKFQQRLAKTQAAQAAAATKKKKK